MKSEISSLDLHYLLKELAVLVGGKINQIYQSGKESIMIEFHVPSKGKHILKILIGKMMYLASSKGKTPEKPPGFCIFLRRYLKSARLRKIEQLEFERIICLTFETKETTLNLIVEIFSKGNIVLCDNDLTIISPLEIQKWKDRIVRKGQKYLYPKKEYNFLLITEEEFKTLLQKSNKENLVKTLALDLGLGGAYAEELCLASTIDKSVKSNTLTPEQSAILFHALTSLRSRTPEPSIIYADLETNEPEGIKGIIPIPLEIYKALKQKKFSSFSAALDSVFTAHSDDVHIEDTKTKAESKLDKIQDIVHTQKQRIIGLEKSALENQKKGEFIYENYTILSDVLSQIKEARKKLSWSEIKVKLKNHKLVKSINEKTGEINLNI